MSTKPLFDSGWELPGIRSAEKFFAALPEILPLSTNLCFEGTSITSDVQSLLASNAATQTLQIPPGTIWPKPNVFHVRATEQFLDQLEAHETIDMVLKIDQQAQYRVGTIEFLGVSPATREKFMESLPKPGEIFDGTRLEDFFKVNRSILPSDGSRDDVNVRRDPKVKTVAILFDFRTCPPHSN